MKPSSTRTRTGSTETKSTLSLQDELVAAIHGAFEVAVEITVREVSKLVDQVTGDACEDMRRENESLKQRLQEAEAMLDSTRLLKANHTDVPTCAKQSPNLRVGKGVRGVNRADQTPNLQYEHLNRTEREVSGVDGKMQQVTRASDAEKSNGCSSVCDVFPVVEVSEETSRVCMIRLESIHQACQDLQAQLSVSPPLPCRGDTFRVKLETPEEEEEEGDVPDCFSDSIKVEDFSPECMSAVQSKMLEEWKPEVLDEQSQDSDTQPPPATPNLIRQLPPASEAPSLSEEFPHVFQLEEPSPIQEASQQVYGVRLRTSRNPNNPYACKYCGQIFQLPSLLRRHYGQCHLRLQQCFQQPVAGSKRNRILHYPPGCSPFRCTVCNREFNRMENLKTHLRIHTGERPYTCSVCSKCFRHSGALTRHFRIHTGEKPYVCGQCGKSFRNPGGLKFHQRSHNK